MNFRQFNKDTDTLEVGTKIRLAGREGEIDGIESAVEEDDSFNIVWSDGIRDYIFCLQRFTFEIADKPAKPLTIDKRVKDRLLKILTDTMWGMEIKPANIEEARAFLNSLEET